MIRVLVADDEQKVSQLICNLIDWPALDMQVVGVASNGLEALDLIAGQMPDVVITDIRMPGCDGLELVRRAKELQPALEFIIISGYRYFDYAQSAIKYGVSDYLLKPVNKEELTNTLEKMRQKHLSRTRQLSQEEALRVRLQSDIDKLRAGLFAEIDAPAGQTLDPERINGDYHYHLQPGCYQFVLAKIDGDYESLASGGLAVLQDKCGGILREALRDSCFDFEIAFEGSVSRVLLNYAEDKRETVRKLLLSALEEMRVQGSLFPDAVLTLALGSTETEAEGLRHSLHTAQAALAGRLLEGAGSLLAPAKGGRGVANAEELLAWGSRALETAMEVFDGPAAEKAVGEFCNAVLAAPGVTGGDVVYLASEYAFAYLQVARKLGFAPEKPEQWLAELARRMETCPSAEKLLALLARSVMESFDAALAQRQSESSKPVRTAQQYIAANYMRPITLEQVSREVGFNASYFSVLFKKETGQNFLEYLQEVRINKAKELLRDTNLSVAQICEDVGYADIKYFGKAFKKHTGIKPGEFRKLYS